MMPFEFYWNYFLHRQSVSIERMLWNLEHGLTDWLVSLLMVFFILQPLEFLRPWNKNQRKLRRHLGIDVFYTIFNIRLMWVLFGSALMATWVAITRGVLREYTGMELSPKPTKADFIVVELDGLPVWARYVALYLFADLVEYLRHWLSHRVNFIWQFHKVHHSSKELDIWNAYRFHFAEMLWGNYSSYFAMALIGFPVEEVFIASLVLSVTNVYSHSNINLPLGPLKYIFNNPQLHIWHHAASVDPRRNVNFGASLAVWDYLLGTAYRPEGRDRPELGYDGDDEMPTGLIRQIVFPFRAIAGDIGRRLRRAAPRSG